MKILIMCGGKGRRLGTQLNKIPKPLISLQNKTILELKIDQYLDQGFKEFILCVGYKGDMIREVLSEKYSDIGFEFSDSGENAGILKRIYDAKELFGDNVIMTYGDTFTDIRLNEFVNVHKKGDSELTIVVAPIQNPFGLVDFDSNNKVLSFKEKPIMHYYIGYAVINKSVFSNIPKDVIDLPDGEGLVSFYQSLSSISKMGVYYHNGLQITFNTETELKAAKEDILKFYTVINKEF